MNRAQRRKQKDSQKNNFKTFNGYGVPTNPRGKMSNEPDFSSVPLATMCMSIQFLIDELRNRGIPIYDFDNKEKEVRAIQILQGKVYFLAAKEEDLR